MGQATRSPPTALPVRFLPFGITPMLAVYLSLAILVVVLPISGLLWFWFVRSQD